MNKQKNETLNGTHENDKMGHLERDGGSIILKWSEHGMNGRWCSIDFV